MYGIAPRGFSSETALFQQFERFIQLQILSILGSEDVIHRCIVQSAHGGIIQRSARVKLA